MGQVTIHLEDELETKVEAEAHARKLSTSQWIAALIRQKLASEWPLAVRKSAGSWKD